VKCKGCNEEIPMNNVQQGGFHMGCAEGQVEVFKCRINGSGPALVLQRHNLDAIYDDIINLHDEDTIEIEKTTMSRIEFDNMQEFRGW